MFCASDTGSDLSTIAATDGVCLLQSGNEWLRVIRASEQLVCSGRQASRIVFKHSRRAPDIAFGFVI